MTDNNMESDLTGTGASSQPSQTASPAGDKPSSPVEADALESALERIKTLESQLSGLQSKQDKNHAKFSKDVKSMKEQIERYEQYKASGLKPDEAIREMQLDDLLAERQAAGSSQVSGQGEDGTKPTPTSVDASVIAELGLDVNSPKVLELMRNNDASLTDFINLAVEQKVRAAQPANPASITGTGSGDSADDDTLEAVTAELQAEMGKQPMNMVKVRELRAKQQAMLPRK